MPNVSSLIRSRTVSLAAAIGTLVVTYFVSGSIERAAQISPLIVLAVACIWFCEEMGAHIGFRISESSPGIAIAIGGWFLMTAMLVAEVIKHQ